MTSALTTAQWLYNTLTGDATLMAAVTGVYADVAPPEADYPFVVTQAVAADDVLGVGSAYIMTTERYTVRVIGVDTFSAIETAANRINTILHRTSGATATGSVLACVRESYDRITEVDGGKIYRVIMQRFTVYTQ